MAQDSTQGPIIPGTIRFIQHHLPALEAGEYQLNITQTLTVQKPDPQNPGQKTSTTPDIPVASHRFAVAGERFTLTASETPKQFPPANSQGEYSNILPHIVFKRRTLPWERTPEADGSPTIKKVGQNTESDVASWLALLLFDQSEGINQAKDGTVLDLVPTGSSNPELTAQLNGATGQLPDGYASLFTAGAILDYGEKVTDVIKYIDVPRALFDQIAPSLNDLKYLAHARRVTVPPKSHPDGIKANNSDGNGSSPSGSDKGIDTDYAVVIGNRLPKAGSQSIAFLVSLERLGDHLPADGGTANPGNNNLTGFRLPVLRPGWSFTAISEKYSFKVLLESLNNDHKDVSLLRLPGDDSQTNDTTPAGYVTQALAAGYTTLAHDLRTGDQTVSWYRGPFTPYPVPFTIEDANDAAAQWPFFSADAATGYNPNSGMFDISYSSAWQIGRLLALANRQFATELYYWKREQIQKMIALYEFWLLTEATPEPDWHNQVDPNNKYPTLTTTIKNILSQHPFNR